MICGKLHQNTVLVWESLTLSWEKNISHKAPALKEPRVFIHPIFPRFKVQRLGKSHRTQACPKHSIDLIFSTSFSPSFLQNFLFSSTNRLFLPCWVALRFMFSCSFRSSNRIAYEPRNSGRQVGDCFDVRCLLHLRWHELHLLLIMSHTIKHGSLHLEHRLAHEVYRSLRPFMWKRLLMNQKGTVELYACPECKRLNYNHWKQFCMHKSAIASL